MTPEELLSIMRHNVVKTGLLKNTKVYGRPERLSLTEDTVFKAKHHLFSCKVYNVRQAKEDESSFRSYVCDYGRNEINYQVLGTEADFCFTITMNGCTFGIGSPTGDGSVLVSHGNMAELEGTDEDPTGDQFERQLKVGQQFHGHGTTFLTPEMYRRKHANVTMVGMRIKGKWKFFYQRYIAVGGGTFRLLSFDELKTQSIKH